MDDEGTIKLTLTGYGEVQGAENFVQPTATGVHNKREFPVCVSTHGQEAFSYSDQYRTLNTQFDIFEESPSQNESFDEFPVFQTHLDPEYLLGRTKEYTIEGDIYSLGILLWEIRYNRRAYIDGTPLAKGATFQEFIYYAAGGQRPRLHRIMLYDDLDDLIKKCWAQDARRRYSARDMVNELIAE